MSDQPTGFDPRQAESLDRAIDRIVAGDTPAATGDAQLDRLVSLAARLHHDLPRDLPDPAFRSRLKDDLTGRQSAMPTRERRSAQFRRHLTVYGSVAAVFVVVLIAGAIAFWPDSNGPTENPSTAKLVQTTSIAATAVLPLATAPIAGANDTRVAEPTPAVATTFQAPTEGAVSTEGVSPPPAATNPVAPSVTTQPTQPPAQGTATVLLASLPAVDPATIEHGPVPAAEGGGSGPSTGVTYLMDAGTTALATAATVYYLAPPAEDPVTFCSDLARQTGVSTDDVHATDIAGQTEVFAGEPGHGTLYWRPDAGVFQYSNAAAGNGQEIQAAAVGDRALDWLGSIGYPVGALGEPDVDDLGDQWLVEIPYARLPVPGIGHPLGVTLILGRDGVVAEARGFWLSVNAQEPVSLVSIADAWSVVTRGGGYWRDGGMSAEGGEFRADAVRLSSVLTKAADDLVLQPVIEFSGTFMTRGGTPAQISVFVAATGR